MHACCGSKATDGVPMIAAAHAGGRLGDRQDGGPDYPTEAVRALMAQRFPAEALADRPKERLSMLMCAASLGDADMLQLLLDAGKEMPTILTMKVTGNLCAVA